MLIARDDAGHIAGTLLLRGPGADTVFAPMLGPATGNIGCVGVAAPKQGEGIGTNLARRRHPQLSHWLDNPRILLLPRRLPPLEEICHVLQTYLVNRLRLPSATSPDNSICSPPETIRANNRAFCARYLLPSRIFS